MKKSILCVLVFILLPFSLIGQEQEQGQVKGKITDSKNHPLSNVSIYLDKSITGTTSNNDGGYVLNLSKKGNYIIVFQFLGYKAVTKKIEIISFPYELNIILEEENVVLDEISISTKDNPANKIIRNVIANKDRNTDKLAKYTASFYSRGLSKIKEAPEKILGQGLGDFGGGLDATRSGIIYLSETISEIAYQKRPKKFKETITASKRSGKDNGVSFNRAEDANFNFYDNNIEFGNDLVSPISINAFRYYRFKLEGTFYDKNGKLINKIKLTPKSKNDPVFSGSIYIVEDDWALYGVDVSVTGAQVNIVAIDTLTLKQDFNYSEDNKSWVLISQSLTFKVDFFGFKFDGKFSYVYSNYNFTPDFRENTFSNEVLSFAKEATKKDAVYWNEIRPVPLTIEEVKDYKIKDSIKIVRKSKKYLDSLNKIQNSYNLLSPIMGYTYKNSYEKWSLSFDGLVQGLGFNSVQGFNTSIGTRFFKNVNDKGKWWTAGAKINYGFSEKRLRPTFFFTKKWNNVTRAKMTISGGVTTPQFNGRTPISVLDNSIRSLFLRENYLKIFEKGFVRINYSEEIKNGIYFSSNLAYAKRKPLFNTSNFSFASQKKNNPYTSNNPVSPLDFENAAFTEHEIAILNLGVKFVFGQKYLSYPDSKFNIGNEKFPSLGVYYKKTFGASRGAFNSDLFTANLKQDIHTGNYGKIIYNVRGGIFLKKKKIAFMDYLQANGNQLTFVTSNQLNSFGLLEYYNLYTNDKYAEAHIEHDFKGAILGKIPLINKLNLHLIGGSKFLFMAAQKPYTEYSVGAGNIGFGKWRFLRIDYVRSNFGGIKNDGLLFRLSLFN
ncbi:MAG: DUF5686 and carboxypeptidase regulatory-like domain-containing protein [Polaribacter sp.]|nr:DUF5686 and carboxypeptidase regulatory-like domain-containing protein [Polaribacter sp.]